MFDNVLKTLTDLNADQIVFLIKITESLLLNEISTSYKAQGEVIASQYLIFLGHLNGTNKNMSFPKLLETILDFSNIELYALNIMCRQMLIKNRLFRKTEIRSQRNLFPDHLEENKAEVQTAPQQISALIFDSSLVEHEDKSKALSLITQAIKIAQSNGLPYSHIIAARQRLAQDQSINIIDLYKSDLSYYSKTNKLKDTYILLERLINEFIRKQINEQALAYLDQAIEILSVRIQSDAPVASHPDYEGYERLMLRARLVQLNLRRRSLVT